MRLALLGLGQIGGSVARAAHAAGWHVGAWTPSGAGPRLAHAEGAIDLAAGTLREAVGDADLVVLAAPPGACLDLMERLAGTDRSVLAEHAVVTDVASTKVVLGSRAEHLGLRFVGGHPMAGREMSGFAAADADLFRDRPWVVVPPLAADEDAVSRVEALARACGARPLRMTAADHDDAVAAISHLPLVLAAVLVEAVAGGPGDPVPPGWPTAAALAAGGWASATRLARGDATMGAGIARTNAGPLAARLRDVRDRLDEWLALLEQPSADGLPDESMLRERLAAARDRLGKARVTDERVLVVPRDRIMDGRGWRGVRGSGAAALLDVIAAEGRFEPRVAMERDPRFKQVIPYLVLGDRGRFFLMRRTRAGGDERLHDKLSIGIGGHLNPGDVDLAGGLAREWAEEVAADFVPEFHFVGLLNDDETEVGRVHLGVVYLAEAAGRAVRIHETHKLEGEFAEPAAVRAVYDRLETWSQLVLDVVDDEGSGAGVERFAVDPRDHRRS